MPRTAFLALALFVSGPCHAAPAFPVAVSSFNPWLHAIIETNPTRGISYQVEKNAQTLLEPARLGITIGGEDLGAKAQLLSTRRDRIQRSYPLLGAKTTATERANTAVLDFQSGAQRWQMETRAADDGFAFRFVVDGEGRRVVNGEATAFRLPATSKVWFGERNNDWKLKSYAGTWMSAEVDAMPKISSQGPVQGAPLVFELATGGLGVLCEAAGFDYSGMRLRAVGERTFVADF